MKKIGFKSIFTVIISAVIMMSICTFNSQSIETEAYGSKSRDYWIYTRSNHLTKDYTLTQSDYEKYIIPRSFVDGVDDRETSTLSRYVSGCVQFNYWDGTEWCNSGDGFIVGDNVIATAAHVVAYKGEVKELNKSNTNYIYTGDGSSGKSNDSPYRVRLFNADGTEYGNLWIESVHVPQKYFTSDNYDYALVTLANTQGIDWEQFGQFKLGTVLDGIANLTGNSRPLLKSVGYSVRDLPTKAKRDKTYGMYVGEGYVTGIAENTLNYNCDTFGGQSGCPILTTINYNNVESDTVVAIHTGGGNTGTRITSPILQFFYNNYKLNELEGA